MVLQIHLALTLLWMLIFIVCGDADHNLYLAIGLELGYLLMPVGQPYWPFRSVFSGNRLSATEPSSSFVLPISGC
jgi:hypothetical protein